MTKLIVLTGLPTKEKGWLARDLAAHYHAQGQRVAVLDNASIADDLGEVRDHVELVTMRGGCACCSVAGALFKSMNDLAGRVDIAVMAANNQTHVENLIAVLDNLVDGSDAPLTVQTVALVDERTTCCFPYVAEMLTAHTDITLHAPFSAADVLAEQ